jgi:hypothetical protein
MRQSRETHFAVALFLNRHTILVPLRQLQREYGFLPLRFLRSGIAFTSRYEKSWREIAKAHVAELADAYGSGPYGETRGGSSPLVSTISVITAVVRANLLP